MAAEVASMTSGSPIESHVEEFKMSEPNGEDQLAPVPILDEGEPSGNQDSGLSTADIELRSELARVLTRRAFPADRGGLLRVAEDEAAPLAIINLINRLPDGRTFSNVGDTWHALGGADESASPPAQE
jgi:hypothetical protein